MLTVYFRYGSTSTHTSNDLPTKLGSCSQLPPFQGNQ